jgi:sulfonate transport system substrate-binding protein
MSRRGVISLAFVFVAGFLIWLIARPSELPAQEQKVLLRISHFRPSIPATLQKARGSLEQKLTPLGVAVQWNEFKVTTDSILALSSGSIDVSVGGLEGSLAAIASGVPLQIIATGPHRAPKTGWFTAILVRDESAIRQLADLRGKKIAVARGGFSEAVLATAVEKGGGRYPDDVKPVYLSSADAAGAFAQGAVDAVLTLDPYIPSIQREVRARILTDNQQLGYPTIWAAAVTTKFAEQHPKLIDLLIDELVAVGPWIAGHRREAATSLASVVGFDATLWGTTVGRASYVMEVPSPATIPDIQFVADELLRLGVVRTRVDAAASVRARGERLR